MSARAYCSETIRALEDGAALTGFSTRAVAALAHLQDAWTVADIENRRFIEDAMRELLACLRRFSNHRDLVREVLRYRLDDEIAAELEAAVMP